MEEIKEKGLQGSPSLKLYRAPSLKKTWSISLPKRSTKLWPNMTENRPHVFFPAIKRC